MLLIVFSFVLSFIFFAVSKLFDEYDWKNLVLSILGCFFAAVFVVLAIIAIVTNIFAKGKIESNKQRYNSLVYQLENDIYENDNDLGKKELYDQIQDWNEDLARGKALQHDIWVGAFYSDIYDEFNFIELD